MIEIMKELIRRAKQIWLSEEKMLGFKSVQWFISLSK